MKKNVWILLVSISFLIIGCCIMLFSTHGENHFNLSGVVVNEGVIPGYTAEQIQEMMQRQADKSLFSFEINARPVFEDGESEGALRIANPPYGAYAIEVEIKLDNNQKTVFKTVKLQPNQYIEKAKLFENLKAGEYPATATIKAYDLENDQYVGTSSAKLIIKVEN